MLVFFYVGVVMEKSSMVPTWYLGGRKKTRSWESRLVTSFDWSVSLKERKTSYLQLAALSRKFSTGPYQKVQFA